MKFKKEFTYLLILLILTSIVVVPVSASYRGKRRKVKRFISREHPETSLVPRSEWYVSVFRSGGRWYYQVEGEYDGVYFMSMGYLRRGRVFEEHYIFFQGEP